MRQPNLLIIGAQKCGTTWLHHVLNKSAHLYGSRKKELNYWNKKTRGDFNEYCRNFEGGTGKETYFYESTPHYFRLPRNGLNIARGIREGLGDIPLLLMLRNPVDRYLSCITHHMMMNRFDWTEEITEISDHLSALSLGYYRRIYDLYSAEFSTIHTLLYDDMVADKRAFVTDVMTRLGLRDDIANSHLNAVLNSKTKKHRRAGDLRPLPRLNPEVAQELRQIYRDDVLGMQDILHRDLGHWLRP
ncbi:MAG: sulfotransferase [Paracoccus sp.]|nr:sulfotransferase [Paracoccus sp. (in: a-proteobacteria)]